MHNSYSVRFVDIAELSWVPWFSNKTTVPITPTDYNKIYIFTKKRCEIEVTQKASTSYGDKYE